MDTHHFREQHAAIARLAHRLDEEARRCTDAHAVTTVLGVLDQFARALTEHLEAEDGELYPAMMSSDDPQLAALAHRYFAEMGGITDLFGLYRARWNAATITADPAKFARETRLLLDGLFDRIRRENENLYPAFERLKAAA